MSDKIFTGNYIASRSKQKDKREEARKTVDALKNFLEKHCAPYDDVDPLTGARILEVSDTVDEGSGQRRIAVESSNGQSLEFRISADYLIKFLNSNGLWDEILYLAPSLDNPSELMMHYSGNTSMPLKNYINLWISSTFNSNDA